MAYRNRELQKALGKIQSGHYFLPPDPRKFRVSSLPYCPILHVLDVVENPDRKIPFESGFYFHIGHAIHNIYQTVARHTLPDNFIGDWRCTRVLNTNPTKTSNTVQYCNRVAGFCSARKALKANCPHGHNDCHRYLTYQELQVAELDVTGHTDLLYRSRPKRYHLVDIKTTSSFLFESPKRAVSYGYYPSEKYIEQIQTYLVLLERQYKIRIVDYTIAYQGREKALAIGRDKNPALRLFSYKATNRMRRKILRNLKRYQRLFNIANVWLLAKATKRKRYTDKLYQARPCHRSKDYHEKMASRFMSNEPCKYHVNQMCYNGKMLKTLQKLEQQ